MKNDIITLKELVDELIFKGKICKDIKTKHVRDILRSEKGRHLENISLKEGKWKRWNWSIELKDDVELELMSLINCYA